MYRVDFDCILSLNKINLITYYYYSMRHEDLWMTAVLPVARTCNRDQILKPSGF